MTTAIEFILGLVLVSYPFWCRKDIRIKVKRVLVVTGIALFCSAAVGAWLASSAHDPSRNHDLWNTMYLLERNLSGVIIGLILSLIVQGELLPARKRPIGGNTGEKGTER